MLYRNTWNDLIEYKLFVLRIVTWSYNYLKMVIISDLKPYNCVTLIKIKSEAVQTGHTFVGCVGCTRPSSCGLIHLVLLVV